MEENKIEEQKNNIVAVIEKPEESVLNQEDIKLENLQNSKEKIQITSNSKKKLGLILGITVIFIILIFFTIFAVVNISNEKIINGVKISHIDVSKLSKEEAKTKIANEYSKRMENEIYLKYGEFESTTSYNALEVQYQIDQAIEQAHQIGRSGNLIKDNLDIISAWAKGTEIELEVTIDKEMLNQVVANINNSIEGAVVQSDYYQQGEKLIITSGKTGIQVEENQ